MRVHPGASRDEVGSRYGSDEPPVLVVRVAAPATDGRANERLLGVLAEAFGVHRRGVAVVSGARSRTKIVEVTGGDRNVLDRLLTR